MSHVTAIKTELKDIAAVKAACLELGLVFKENQKTHRWFGRWVNDFNGESAAFNRGVMPADYGKCDHAIEVPGSGYDIGLVRNPATQAYKVVFDFYGTGQVIQQTIGKEGEKLVQRYGLCKAEALAKSRGHTTVREKADGKIRLRVRSNRF